MPNPSMHLTSIPLRSIEAGDPGRSAQDRFTLFSSLIYNFKHGKVAKI